MNAPFAWISSNAEMISALTSILMLFVWGTYLQLTYAAFTRQRRPRLILHHAQGTKLESSCLLINMSQEPIHVVCIMVLGTLGKESVLRQVTDYRHVALSEQAPSQWQGIIKQGPMQPGGYMLLGTFSTLIGHLAEEFEAEGLPKRTLRKGDGTPVVETLEVRVIAMYGPEDRPIGAYRRFSLELMNGQVLVTPMMPFTKQLANRFERRLASRWLNDCLGR